MKKFLSLLLVLGLFSAVCVAFAEENPDTFTSASVKTWYPDNAISGQQLVDDINSKVGFYAVATVNPDGTPNLAYVGMRASMDENGDIILMLGMMENQTALNLDRTGVAVAYYMNNVYRHAGDTDWGAARMDLTVLDKSSSEMTWGGETGIGWIFNCSVNVRSGG